MTASATPKTLQDARSARCARRPRCRRRRRQHQRAQHLAIALHRHGHAEHQPAIAPSRRRVRRLAGQRLQHLRVVARHLVGAFAIEGQRLAAGAAGRSPSHRPAGQPGDQRVAFRRRQELDLDTARPARSAARCRRSARRLVEQAGAVLGDVDQAAHGAGGSFPAAAPRRRKDRSPRRWPRARRRTARPRCAAARAAAAPGCSGIRRDRAAPPRGWPAP